MRVLYILLSLFLSVEHVHGMEGREYEEVMEKARSIVRQVVNRNVEGYINTRRQFIDKDIQATTVKIGKCKIQQKKAQLTEELASLQEQKNQLRSNLATFQASILDERNVLKLNNIIINYLKTGEAPGYIGCDNSFQDVAATLKNAGIHLDEDTDTLKFLTKNENKEAIKKMARDIVRQIVLNNLQETTDAPANVTPKKIWGIDASYLNFREDSSGSFLVKDLNEDQELNKAIMECLHGNKPPIYLDCQNSFKGAKEALTKAGIGLDGEDELKFLSPDEKFMLENGSLMSEFVVVTEQ